MFAVWCLLLVVCHLAIEMCSVLRVVCAVVCCLLFDKLLSFDGCSTLFVVC